MIFTGYYRCTNSSCPSENSVKELDVVREEETGAQYLRHEDEVYCQDCGHQMDEEN